ncbi:MAG TPA: acyl-CoA dehydratase activase [Thermodesulfovibrionales bacterium]|nr:acyl-CoA dehydratase activase [Thermodesulfovibrionales bacterium]
MRFIGLDAGSVSVKLVLLDEKGGKIEGYYERHKGRPLTTAYSLLQKTLRGCDERDFSLSVTGSAGRLIAAGLGAGFVNEVVAQTYATKRLCPHVKTIFELGGEDSKLILLSEEGVRDFSMNSVCAAGTGSFLDQQAERLRLSITDFSELALKSEKPSRIAGRCSVFAKSDMIHLQQIATPMEDIVAGLCFSVARNFKGSIVRGRAIGEPVSFHGGVAANRGMVRAFREVFGFEHFSVPDDFALMGALGAALKNKEDAVPYPFTLEKLKAFIESSRLSERGHGPLILPGDDFFERHPQGSLERNSMELRSGDRLCRAEDLLSAQRPLPKITAYLGIDIGSISTNLAVIDENGSLLAKRYLMTAGRPIDAVRQGLEEIAGEIGARVTIAGVGTTGSGRYMIADYVGADVVKNEITAQATAAASIDGRVDTIFEIGGQDSKFISLKEGVIVDFEMNKACAAGTGSFLEEQAEKLNIPIKEEFADSAFSAKNPCRLGERCTVFMENSLMANLQKGAEENDLLAGLAYSIVQNYINKVVAGKPIGKRIFFQGGVAFNKSVVAAFEKYLGKTITVPPHHDVTGAIGMALIAMRQRKNRSSGNDRLRSTFKGFALSRRPYQVSSFECKGCPNVCEINRVKIEGEDTNLFYGGRCEKYDMKRNTETPLIPDLFAFREEMLWKPHNRYLEQKDMNTSRGKREGQDAGKGAEPRRIGIPYVFFFHDYLPFWTTLLWELGFAVEVSPKTNREIVRAGIEGVLADTCFPVKVAHGHIKYLIDNGVTTLFIPSFINMNPGNGEFERGFACPLTQTMPYAARVAHPDATVVAPLVNLQRGRNSLIDELRKAFRSFRITKRDINRAIDAAEAAQTDFFRSTKEKGSEILSSLRETTVVIVGRPYNAFDSGTNLTIPRKVSELGVLAIPMDFIPLEKFRIDDRWPNMYWRSGQRILKAARFIKENPLLHAIFIGNFSCGPDSFILKYFDREMGEKTFLHIEIDEHSADAGAITRCEAFLDSIGQQQRSSGSGFHEADNIPLHSPPPEVPCGEKRPFRKTVCSGIAADQPKRSIFIPRMSDHAFALAAAFERCGVLAEVLPESDRESADIGRRHVSGKECYPCTVTTGDMLKKVFSSDFRREKTAFFMPSGSGPCRFGQYNVFHRMILDELGYHDIPILSPNQDENFYRQLGVVSRDFATHAWRGIIAVELLNKCLHETRPYEEERGAADTLHRRYLKRVYHSLRGADGRLETSLKDMREDFEKMPRRRERRPLIGIVGEIFVRSHRFSNEDIVRRVEALGGEAWLAPVEEWIYYVNSMALRNALIKKDRSAIIELLLKTFFQKRTEHRLGRHFAGFLKTLREPGTKEILKKASPYLHDSFEGEAVLSIGKSVDLIEKGVSGIINAMPFGCMPGTVVTTLIRGVSREYGVPCTTVPFDGTESSTTEIQLEAFMNQAAEYDARRRNGRARR